MKILKRLISGGSACEPFLTSKAVDMNKQLLARSLAAGFGISSVSAQMTWAQLEQFALKGDKVRIAQNVVLPAAVAGYEYTQGQLSHSMRLAIVGGSELLKNAGMAMPAALETDSLAADLSDILATVVFVDTPHLFDVKAKRASGVIKLPGYGIIQGTEFALVMELTACITRVAGEVGGALIRARVNKMIKERLNGANAMAKRRIIRTVTFAATKALVHVLTVFFSTMVAENTVSSHIDQIAGIKGEGDKIRLIKDRIRTGFTLDRFILDTIIPTINYALAEVEGHIIAQRLIAAEAVSASSRQAVVATAGGVIVDSPVLKVAAVVGNPALGMEAAAQEAPLVVEETEKVVQQPRGVRVIANADWLLDS